MITFYDFSGHDRQATAFQLLARLGQKYCWHHFLADCTRSKISGLGGSDLRLMPICYQGQQPTYDQKAIDVFVRDAKLIDPTLGAIKTVPAKRYLVDAASITPTIPPRWRRAVHVTVPPPATATA